MNHVGSEMSHSGIHIIYISSSKKVLWMSTENVNFLDCVFNNKLI